MLGGVVDLEAVPHALTLLLLGLAYTAASSQTKDVLRVIRTRVLCLWDRRDQAAALQASPDDIWQWLSGRSAWKLAC